MRRRIGLFAFICLGVVTGGLVQLKLPENSPVGSIVSELRGSIDSSTPINAELEFRIVKSDRQNGLEIFEIEGNQGKLIVKQSPDREILCPGEEKCLLEVQVIQFISQLRTLTPSSTGLRSELPTVRSGRCTRT